jgi:hypothetical protein
MPEGAAGKPFKKGWTRRSPEPGMREMPPSPEFHAASSHWGTGRWLQAAGYRRLHVTVTRPFRQQNQALRSTRANAGHSPLVMPIHAGKKKAGSKIDPAK